MAIVQADLIQGRGDQLLAWDLEAGLEWLNLTVTANRSYIDVQAGFGGFIGIFGFRFATSAEVSTLFQHAGISTFGGPGPGNPLNLIGIELIQDLMNGKVVSPGNVSTFGMVRDGVGTGIPSPGTPLIIHNTYLSRSSPDFSYTDSGVVRQKAGERSPTVGAYLVKKRIFAVTPNMRVKPKSLRKGK